MSQTHRASPRGRVYVVDVTPGRYRPTVDRKPQAFVFGALLGVVVVAVLAWPIATWAHHQPGPWPESLQAAATVVLIAVTATYVAFTGRSVMLTRESLDIQRKRVEASQRPYVIAAPTREWIDRMPVSEDWADVLPIKNLGPGVAINVRVHLGNLGEPAGIYVDSVSTSLGPGDREDLRLNWASDVARVVHWDTARGWIDFEDFSAARWRSEFSFYREGARINVQVHPPVLMMRADGTVPS